MLAADIILKAAAFFALIWMTRLRKFRFQLAPRSCPFVGELLVWFGNLGTRVDEAKISGGIRDLLYLEGGWRGSWHCLSGEHLLCILFSWPESRKTACAGRFEFCGCQPIMLMITA